MISEAIEGFHDEWGMYPEEEQSATEILRDLSTPINGGGPLLLDLWQGDDGDRKDPWGRVYCMVRGTWERPPHFYSAGPNGIDEDCRQGSDDVRYPKEQ